MDVDEDTMMDGIHDRVIDELLHEWNARLDKELYAAWRAGYDYFYLVQRRTATPIPEQAYIPSNNPNHTFDGFRVHRYDLRDQNLSPEARKRLEEYNP